MRVVRAIFPILIALVFAVTAVNYFSLVTVPVKPFNGTVGLEIGPGRNGTRIQLPPVGAIHADTHDGPVSLNVRLDAVDIKALEDLLYQAEPQKQLVASLTQKANGVLRELIFRAIIVAGLAGSLGYLLVGPRRWTSPVIGAFIGLLVVSATLGVVYQSFNPESLEAPKFSGAMEYAPWMISFVQRALTGMEDWGEKLGQMAVSIQSLSQRAQAASNLVESGKNQNDLVVLHVSDIHNNPAGYAMIAGIIKQFDVNLVIDTGDTSDFGTKMEVELFQAIESLNVKYLWVAGNHDSPDIIRAMRGLPNVSVLDGSVDFQGLLITGRADPAASGNDVVSSEEELLEYAERVRSDVTEASPDVAAVHNYQAAKSLAGTVPVILTGHNHKASWEFEEGSIIINAGSTGAEGLRGLQKSKGGQYTAMLLYFSVQPEGGYELNSLDYLEFSADGSGFSLDRQALKGNADLLTNSSGIRQQN